ncbi:MAG: hypothetical protein Q8908_00460 [Bacteroidota bacterium]|nr:hypothetical protein [Bacteroidota bacterium]
MESYSEEAHSLLNMALPKGILGISRISQDADRQRKKNDPLILYGFYTLLTTQSAKELEKQIKRADKQVLIFRSGL